jgi:hypothetical protein
MLNVIGVVFSARTTTTTRRRRPTRMTPRREGLVLVADPKRAISVAAGMAVAIGAAEDAGRSAPATSQ